VQKTLKQHYLWIIFAIAVLAQLFFPISMVAEKNDIIKNGAEFKIRTQPIDPADPLRGRYVAINMTVNVPEAAKDEVAYWGTNYLHLTTGTDGFAEVVAISKHPIPEKNVVKLENVYIFENGDLRLPYDRYYMQEKAAPKAERAFFGAQEDTYVTLRVKKGMGVISGLYIGDVAIEEYVRGEGDW